MPSLRRSASSPNVVRRSPYSSSLAVARGNGHRRSSGSETSTRRVLADIEWWRVTEGQCDPSTDHDRPNVPHGVDVLDVPATATVIMLTPDVDVQRAPAPAGAEAPQLWIPEPADSEYGLPTEQFSGLSITPHTPTRRHRALHSATSSLESTPEAPEALLPVAAVTDVDDFVYGFDMLPPLSTRRVAHSFDLLLMRSDDASSTSGPAQFVPSYADFAVSPLSSAPLFLN